MHFPIAMVGWSPDVHSGLRNGCEGETFTVREASIYKSNHSTLYE